MPFPLQERVLPNKELFNFAIYSLADTPTPPTDGLAALNNNLIIGIVVGGGVGILLLILCIGSVMTCYLCFKKKKNFRKYVLPYRTYMDGKLPCQLKLLNKGMSARPSK